MDESSTLVDVINAVLAVLPEEYRPSAEAMIALPTLLAMALALWRWVMARWFPKASNHPLVVALDRTLNVLAINSKRLEVRAPVVRERFSKPPPKDES